MKKIVGMLVSMLFLAGAVVASDAVSEVVSSPFDVLVKEENRSSFNGIQFFYCSDSNWTWNDIASFCICGQITGEDCQFIIKQKDASDIVINKKSVCWNKPANEILKPGNGTTVEVEIFNDPISEKTDLLNNVVQEKEDGSQNTQEVNGQTPTTNLINVIVNDDVVSTKKASYFTFGRCLKALGIAVASELLCESMGSNVGHMTENLLPTITSISMKIASSIVKNKITLFSF